MKTQSVSPSAEDQPEWTRLPGIFEFCKEHAPLLLMAFQASAEAKIHCWNLIRICYRFGESPEVQQYVQKLNFLPNGLRREGRPRLGHRLVLEAFASLKSDYANEDARSAILEVRGKLGFSCECRKTRRTLERWQKEWVRAAEFLELGLSCSEAEFNQAFRSAKDLPALIEDIISPPPAQDDGEGDDEEIAKQVYELFRKRFVIRKNPEALAQFLKQAEATLFDNGWLVIPAIGQAKNSDVRRMQALLENLGWKLMPITQPRGGYRK